MEPLLQLRLQISAADCCFQFSHLAFRFCGMGRENLAISDVPSDRVVSEGLAGNDLINKACTSLPLVDQLCLADTVQISPSVGTMQKLSHSHSRVPLLQLNICMDLHLIKHAMNHCLVCRISENFHLALISGLEEFSVATAVRCAMCSSLCDCF